QPASFRGELRRLEVRYYRRRRVLEGVVFDGTGAVTLKWFHGKFEWLVKKYPAGSSVVAYGVVNYFNGGREVIHPDLEIEDAPAAGEMESVVPVYSEVEGVHPKVLRKIMRQAVEGASMHLVGVVPPALYPLCGVDEGYLRYPGAAYKELHFPSSQGEALSEGIERARKAVALGEFFLLELSLLRRRSGEKSAEGIAFRPDFSLIRPLLKTLPFELTGAQKRVLSEIRRDMESALPMLRLLQGDVGSGKTLVALIASLMAAESGYQGAVMAPTEVLAEQHYRNFLRLLDGLPARVELLTGSTTQRERDRISGALALGEVEIIVGTHALIQPDVSFKNLGLAVVDEQHRFGVMQRVALAQKRRGKGVPDLLVMTATPIPRTLSMTVYGDLDLSVIDEMPPGRAPVKTTVVGKAGYQKVCDFIRAEVKKGRQAYVVFPLVEESEKSELKAAVETSRHFSEEVFPDLRVGLLHGRMNSAEKEAALGAFSRGETDILVSTTVIEVGIDVKNATVMAVEHAERFGLSQLHQLRGRVGRGGGESYCFLLVGGPVSGDARERLSIMAATNDGFRIAEEDLKIR
ncbi:ATP-dependent DNA helicase RecG, partial [bacterium]